MGVPTDVESARGILTDAEVERVRGERPWPGGSPTEDVPVGAYVAARLGRAVVDRLVEPLLGGVYAGHADRLSLEATMPALWARAVAGESLVHGGSSSPTPTPTPTSSSPTSGAGGSGRPVFAGLRGGVGRLAELVAETLRARGAVLRTRAVVRGLERTGDGWRLVLGPVPAPEVLDADAVVLAVPPAPASRLLGPHAPLAAERLAGVETASSAVVTLAVERSGLGELPGSGFLVPPVEGRTIKASTFSAAKWTWTGELSDELVHLRTSVGRAREEAVLQREDADLVAVSVEEVSLALGRPLPRLVDAHVQRWGGGLPQYAVGHLSRIRDVLHDVADVPGLEVAGAAYEGVGVPAVVASAVRAARATTDHLSRIPTPRGEHP
jgi:oxygen-dependent protoporphyrinogen oxidase